MQAYDEGQLASTVARSSGVKKLLHYSDWRNIVDGRTHHKRRSNYRSGFNHIVLYKDRVYKNNYSAKSMPMYMLGIYEGQGRCILTSFLIKLSERLSVIYGPGQDDCRCLS